MVSACKTRRGLVMRFVMFILTGLFLLGGSGPAFASGDFSHWPQMDVLELLSPTPPLVERLLREGYIVDTEHPESVQVYATAELRRKLDEGRVAYVKVGQQPNPPAYGEKAALGQYHSYTAMVERLQGYATAYPNILRLDSLGQSAEGRELWVARITDNPDVEEDEPEFKYVSTMHGNEPLGTELMLYLIDLLLTSYGGSSAEAVRLTRLVNETDISIVPMMNPDGHVAGARYTVNGVDLNRNFPSYRLEASGSYRVFDGDPLDTEGREVETQRVMEWTAANSFVLSANLHTGALLVNYPFDEGDVPNGQYAYAPDDALFIDVSLRYSVNNPPMYNSTQFVNGISNGCAWYIAMGGMQDWNYRYASCNEVTLELSTTKKPSQSLIASFWTNNRSSLIAYMESVHIGVRGMVTDACTGAPVYAKVTVAGNAQPVYTDPDVGDYHRMLLPGSYALTVAAPGYVSKTVTGVTVVSGDAIRLDTTLEPVAGCPVEGEGEGVVEGEGTLEGEGADPNIHGADVDGDSVIDLGELLRVVQLYSAFRFQCNAESEDGYAPFGGVCQGCRAYAIDYNPRDCSISLSELLRGGAVV